MLMEHPQSTKNTGEKWTRYIFYLLVKVGCRLWSLRTTLAAKIS